MGSLRSGRASAGMLLLALIAIALLLADRVERGAPGRGAGAGLEPGAEAEAEVVRIVDGDTIEVDLPDGGSETVRYIGIDTPESVRPDSPVECFGPEAAEANGELVEGAAVSLRFDRELRDRYGRLLAYVFVDDTFVNAELVTHGYARTLEIDPNTSEAARLSRLEDEAARSNRGLWAAC